MYTKYDYIYMYPKSITISMLPQNPASLQAHPNQHLTLSLLNRVPESCHKRNIQRQNAGQTYVWCEGENISKI